MGLIFGLAAGLTVAGIVFPRARLVRSRVADAEGGIARPGGPSALTVLAPV